jgi:hypothetical protein
MQDVRRCAVAASGSAAVRNGCNCQDIIAVRIQIFDQHCIGAADAGIAKLNFGLFDPPFGHPRRVAVQDIAGPD